MVEEDRKENPVQLALVRPEPPPPPPATSLEALFEEHHDRVFAAAYRVTGSAHDAEDVLQTIFLRLLKRDDGGADLAPSPGAYLARAAVNAALDIVRSRKVRNPVEVESAGLTSPGPSPERASLDRELGDRLRVALGRLPERAAEMFALKYFEGLTNDDIATALDTSSNVVAVTLFRARARLRRELEATERS